MTSRSVLVTGGLGFIGVQLCRELLRRDGGIHLTIVDDLSSTATDYRDLEQRAEIIIQDLGEFNPGSRRFDEIHHLASPVGSLGILAQRRRVAHEIVVLAQKAADIAMASGAELLFVSSSEIYGQDGQHGEDTPKVIQERRGRRMEYALGKLLAEHMLFNLAGEHGLNVKVCRPFNVIGEGQSSRAGFVVPTFFERAKVAEDLPVFGDGKQQRAFCHVSDVVDGLLAIRDLGIPGRVYNVGNPAEPISIRELAERIIAICGSSSRVVSVDPRVVHGPGYLEAYEKIPNIRRVAEDTGWSPRISLDAALQRILRSYAQTD